MYYILYRITNTLNNKFYIGIHKTSNISDSYMGSGKLLLRAIKKYGVHNFKKEILEYHDSEENLCRREEELVTEDFIRLNNVYNIMPGGRYGSKDRNGLSFAGHNHSSESKDKIKCAAMGRPHSDSTKEKISRNNFARRNPEQQKIHASIAGGKGKLKSYEHKDKIRKTLLDYNLKNRTSHILSPNTGKIRNKVECPYCGKTGAKNTMFRWHFNNCKIRK